MIRLARLITISTLTLVAATSALALIRVNVKPENASKAIHSNFQDSSLSRYSSAAPTKPLHLVFLHHSIGQQWLSEPPDSAAQGEKHPNGGALRRMLEQSNYRVHDATYGSALGEHTDLFDWLPKFSSQMEAVLHIDRQDKRLAGSEQNQIVLFKSCFPNSFFQAAGVDPGSPNGPTLTVSNAKASFRALLSIFEQNPKTLFVFVTTPPFAASESEPLGKLLLKRLLGRPTAAARKKQAVLAREFHDWVVSPDGWLSKYASSNVVIFDYYAILTKRGTSLFLEYPSGNGFDSHPNTQANQLATTALVSFLNQATRRLALPTNE